MLHMQPAKTAKSAAKVGWDVFEELGNQAAKPIFDEAINEFGGFFGASRFGRTPKKMGQEELAHKREEKRLEELKKEEDQKSKARIAEVKKEYSTFGQKNNQEQSELKAEMHELTQEVVKLAKTAGVNTKVHLEQTPQKVGKMDIKRLTVIIKQLRMKADDARSGNELVNQRSNSKRTTGMMAWVSGKQMKIHEQGTLQLQG